VKSYPMDKIRNVALVGPHGVGKTSLADAMLHVTEKVGRCGSVDDGSSVFDYFEEEIERKQTVSASMAWTEVEGNKINIIDTPGVDDFRGDVYASLRVVEGVLFTVKADGGFEVASENLWNHIRTTGLPTFIVVNRMSKEHADWRAVLNELKDRVPGTAPMQLPIGSGEDFEGVVDLIGMKAYRFEGERTHETEIPADLADAVDEAREMLIDAAASADDALTEKYLEEMTLSEEDMIAGLKKGTLEGTVYPVYFTDAVREIGIRGLLKKVVSLLPSSVSRTRSEIQGVIPGTEDETSFTPSADGPLVAYAFKRQFEAQGGDVTWLRIFSGSLKSGDNLKCSDGRSSERMGQLNVVIGKNKEKVAVGQPGDIVLAAKLKNTQTHLSQTLLATQGEIHTTFLLDKLKKQTGVTVERRRPRINFKETIRGTAEKQGRHKKQTGGRGQFGDVHLRIEPMPRGEGFEFSDEIVGGVVPGKFIPAVEKGCRETLLTGLVAGYEMVDVKCALFFGSYHNVDSSEAAFKSAARIALKKAVEEESAKLRPVILEPIMKVSIVVPQAYMGDVMGDVSTRRGAIQGSDADGPYQVVTANIPEDELYQYATTLRSMSQGTGNFTMEFSHYAEVPGDVQKRLVVEHKKSQTAEE